MAVTIIVETGAGVTNANSYVTLAEQKSFLEAHPYGAATLAKGDDAISAGMVQSCRELDVAAIYRGVRKAWDQDREFPRTGLDPVPDTAIPKQIKQAQMEYLRFVLSSDRNSEADGAAVKREKIDVIEVEYQVGAKRDLVPEIVQRLIQPFVQSIADDGAGSGAPAATSVFVDRA